MRIGIITFCDAVNYGAFLQAFSLGEYLKKYNHDVVYIRKKSIKSLYWQIHNLYAFHFDRIGFRNQFRHKWLAAKKRMKITTKKTGYDLIIIGSDEMWQLNGETTTPLPMYWGVGVNAYKKITYAVCSNGTTIQQVEKYPFIKKGLEVLDSISVRDEMTKAVFQAYTKKKIHLDVDPTFLVDLRKYAVEPAISDYILVYTYSLDDSKIKKIEYFAMKYKKKTVVIGNKFDWCDICLPSSPFEALGIFIKADYVITDTFHGAVLSTHFNKNFAVFTSGKEKVQRYLEEYDLTDRIINNQNRIEEILNRPIDYNKVNSVIGNKRQESCNYLGKFIKE